MVELRQGRVGAIEKLSKFKKAGATHRTKPKEEYTHWDYLLLEMVGMKFTKLAMDGYSLPFWFQSQEQNGI